MLCCFLKDYHLQFKVSTEIKSMKGNLRMTNLEYTISIIRNIDKIYIDTSALMNVEELELLIIRMERILLRENKFITVPRAVCLELARHLESTDKSKINLVLRVFEILSNHDKVFIVDNGNLKECDVLKAFADAKLLAELTENRPECKQLLITNDKKLGHDSYNLNNLESCKGHKIKVCYINHVGELHMCECVRQDYKPVKVPETKEIVRVVKVQEPQKKESWVFHIGISVATLILGVVIGKHNNEIAKNIKAVA
jgi:hypothetical protein